MSSMFGSNDGLLQGAAWAEGINRDERHAEDLARMRAELRKKSTDAMYQEAFKQAAADVLDEIVTELKDEAKGELAQRRVSDPNNVELRNEAYAQACAKRVERISNGRVRMSRVSMDRIKNTRSFR